MSGIVCLLFCVLWTTATFAGAQPVKSKEFLDKIKAGLQHASNYLETARDIADLVSRSLSRNHAQQKRGDDGNDETKQSFGPSNLVSAFFRLIGLDSHKVVAITINSVIFLAQMISLLFGVKTPQENIARSMDDEEITWDPLNFTLENKNEKIQNLITQARDPNLPNQLMAGIRGVDSACIRLLLCKSSPVIKAAQKSLDHKWQSHKWHSKMTAWLPSKEEFEINSDECEDRYMDCNLFPSQ